MLFSSFIGCNWKANMQCEREICSVIQVTSVGGTMSPPKLGFRLGSLIRIEPLKAKVRLKVIMLLLHHVVEVGELHIHRLLPFLCLSYVFCAVVLDLSCLHIKGVHSPSDFTQVPLRETRAPFTVTWSLGPSGCIPSWFPTCLIYLHGC